MIHSLRFTLVLPFIMSGFITLSSSADVRAADAVDNITVPENRSELLELPGTFTNVDISDKSVARVIKHGGNKVSVVGKKQGTTRIDFTKGGRGVFRTNVKVTYDVPAVKLAIRRFFPAEAVEVELTNDALVLSGAVTDAEIAKRIQQLATQFAGGAKEPVNVINLMQIRTGQQVMLRVRIGEVKRGSLDIGPQGITGDISTFNRLVDDGMIRLLAEPSLVAISGESAEFLAGGELPIPVGQAGGRIDYKPYGVSVKFTPFVLSQNRIRLSVEPEVSELSNAGTVRINGGDVPGIITRRAKTTVELAPGESFMVAGLIRDDLRGSVDDVLDVKDDSFAHLFKGNNLSHNESELVIAVTPLLVDPVINSNIKLPTDVSNIKSILGGRFEANLSNVGAPAGGAPKKNWGKSAKGLEGSYGHLVE